MTSTERTGWLRAHPEVGLPVTAVLLMGLITGIHLLLGRTPSASLLIAGAGTAAFIVSLGALLLVLRGRDARALPEWLTPGLPIAALLSVTNGVQSYVEGSSSAVAVATAGISAVIFMSAFWALRPLFMPRGEGGHRRGVSVRTAIIIVGGLVLAFASLFAFLWYLSTAS